jgi:hypothetical protein
MYTQNTILFAYRKRKRYIKFILIIYYKYLFFILFGVAFEAPNADQGEQQQKKVHGKFEKKKYIQENGE